MRDPGGDEAREEAAADHVVTRLQACGAVVIKGAVHPRDCAGALRGVHSRLEHALGASGQFSTADDVAGAQFDDDDRAAAARYFGNVASPSHRRDLKLALTPEVKRCLDQLLAVLRPTLRNVLTDEAELCELSALCADPGAAAQDLHPDTQITETHAHCALLTAFLALQEVRAEMGPTEVVPGSNNVAAHAALAAGTKALAAAAAAEQRGPGPSPHGGAGPGGGGGGGGGGSGGGGEAALLAGGWLPPQPALLDAGDVLLMDSRAVHRGSANVSAGRRVLLYASFQVPNNAPPGSTYSLLEEYRGRFRLRNHARWRDPAAT